MSFLFDETTRRKVIERIGSVPSDREPRWGKMGVARMFAHCSLPFRVALGETELKRTFLGRIFGKLARKRFLRPEPFPRNLPTDKSFVVAEHGPAETERAQLIALIERFAREGRQGGLVEIHPFFGSFTPEDWDLLMWKHLNHHLLQFDA